MSGVVDLGLHRANAAAHEGMRALIAFRNAEDALRRARGRGPDERGPKLLRDRYAASNARLQNAPREYERACVPTGADFGG